MSRRKQARPKSCKLPLTGEDGLDLGEDNSIQDEDTPDVTTVGTDSESLSQTPVPVVEADGTEDDDGEILSDEDPAEVRGQPFCCESCNAIFNSLDQFMDHRNFDCTGDGTCIAIPWMLNDTSNPARSDTPSSSSSSLECSKSPPTGSDSRSPVSDSLTPDLLPFSNGVNKAFPYGCHFCDKAFSRMAYLKIHEIVHGDQMPFKCSHCHRLFRHKRSRDRHMKLHTGIKKYKCLQCNAAFSRSDHLKSHMRTHDGGKPYQCPVCSRGFLTAASLTSHVLAHKTSSTLPAGNRQLECLQCQEKFPTTKELQAHLIVHTVKVEKCQCQLCGECFLGQEALDNHHHDIHENPLELKCPVCFDNFYSTELLCQHMDTHNLPNSDDVSSVHESGDNSNLVQLSGDNSSLSTGRVSVASDLLICPYCMRDDFNNLEMLEIHMQSMHSVKPAEIYTCNYCNAPYPNLYSLHDHMNVVHRNQPCMDIKYPCSLCTKQFPSIEALAEHKKTAHYFKEGSTAMVDSIYCVQCTLAFSDPAALEEHRNAVHKTPASEKVKIGGKMKNRRSWSKLNKDHKLCSPPKRLNMGVMGNGTSIYETVPNSLTCDQCNATFHDMTNFQAHMKLHLESVMTKFTCKQCNQHFQTEDQLENHSSIHYLCMTTEYGCTSCMKLFSKPDELQKHLMDIHAHHLYRCSLCKEIFDSKVNIQVHFAIKHSNECKLFKCTQCDNIFRSETEWQVHVRVNHLHMSKPYRCLFCKESFSNEMELQCHLTTHSKPFKCPMCDSSFHIEYLLDQHMQNIHGDKPMHEQPRPPKPEVTAVKIKTEKDTEILFEQEVPAPVPRTSPMPASSPAAMGSAIWKNTEPMHMCNICDMKFSQQSLLTMHKAQDHGLKVTKTSDIADLLTPPRDKLVVPNSALISALTGDRQMSSCIYCSQTFKNKSEYEKHMRIHLSSENLKCNICDEVFPSGSILAEHKLQHCKIQQGNSCVVCKISLKSEDQFYIHSQEHGYQGSLLQCIVCRQTLASLVELNMHGKHHFQSKPSFYTCCVCLKSFDSKENLVSKLNTSGRTYYVCKPCYHGETVEHTCEKCSQTFQTSAQLDVHKLTHKQTFQCIKCQESFGTEYEIQMHVATHMIQEGNVHECRLCGKNFETPSKLQCHLIEHTYQAGEMRCSICCNVYSSISDIQAHALEHGIGGRKYACSQCNLKFFFSAELENHLFSHQQATSSSPRMNTSPGLRMSPGNRSSTQGSPDSQKAFPNTMSHQLHSSQKYMIHNDIKDALGASAPYQNSSKSRQSSPTSSTTVECPQCHQHFASTTYLQAHQKKCEGHKEERIKCSLCPKVFTSVGTMQQHFFSIHSNIDLDGMKKTYPCTECDEEFPCLSNLQGHMRIHKTDAKFPCPVCKKVFALTRNLAIHMRMHSGEKPYECPVCQKRFSRKENRKSHMRSHLGMKPFLCPVCHRAFSRRRYLRDHIKSHVEHDSAALLEQVMSEMDTHSDTTSEEASQNGIQELSDLDQKDELDGATNTATSEILVH
ncbi:zinc finger protein 423-like isoform X1 [Haliotis cracherodii]|uniref:zinc finger protein 423-like isoform X1 n=1 Tax=Haliotis cracherodii TaxID=6455 RepID=UPI0039ECBEFB